MTRFVVGMKEDRAPQPSSIIATMLLLFLALRIYLAALPARLAWVASAIQILDSFPCRWPGA